MTRLSELTMPDKTFVDGVLEFTIWSCNLMKAPRDPNSQVISVRCFKGWTCPRGLRTRPLKNVRASSGLLGMQLNGW